MTAPRPGGTAGRELLARHPLIDGHNDLPWAMRTLAEYDFDRLDPGGRLHGTHTDLPRMREGGVGAQFWSVYVPSTLAGGEALTATLEQIDFVYRLVDRYPEQLGLARSATEVRDVFASGRIASLLGAEGGHSINESLGALRALYGLGVRYMTLTHNHNTPWADSATDQPAHGGLTDFGRRVVAEMNRLGMLVDLSHVAPTTMHDALAASRAPVIFSHSSCRALCNHVRDVPDDVLTELATNGGVCMVTFVPEFVSEDCRLWRVALEAEYERSGIESSDREARLTMRKEFEETNPRPHATLGQVADHIEHIRELIGVDHAGIGGDYDGCFELPDGLHDVSCYPGIFDELLGRGWSEDECARLAGGNVLRVLQEAELVAE